MTTMQPTPFSFGGVYGNTASVPSNPLDFVDPYSDLDIDGYDNRNFLEQAMDGLAVLDEDPIGSIRDMFSDYGNHTIDDPLGNFSESLGYALEDVAESLSATAGSVGSGLSNVYGSFGNAANIANAVSLYNTQQEMKFNAEQAALNREWQERMSNTAYQRARADLEAAGYNPILAQTQGAASTPSGSTASSAAAESHMPSSDIQKLEGIVAVVKAVFDGIAKAF